MKLIDSHNHLQDSRLAHSRNEIVASLEGLPLRYAVVNGTREEDWNDVLELADATPWIVPSLGLHPWYVQEASPGWEQRLEEHLAERPCAIGEAGLDRWIKEYDLPLQEHAFIAQLRLAARLDRPISIHCLKAWGRLLEILEREPRPARGFLLHSYGGPAEMVRTFADLGAYFSLSSYFAHDRKQRQREAFLEVPGDRLLLETDAPDMLPPGQYIHYSLPEGSLNHPANIEAAYQFAASLLSIPIENLAAQIEENFRRLFAPVLDPVSRLYKTRGSP